MPLDRKLEPSEIQRIASNTFAHLEKLGDFNAEAQYLRLCFELMASLAQNQAEPGDSLLGQRLLNALGALRPDDGKRADKGR